MHTVEKNVGLQRREERRAATSRSAFYIAVSAEPNC